jgi:hypothetical protein
MPTKRIRPRMNVARSGGRQVREIATAPVFSPDEKYVAFICELNGVLVTDVEAALGESPKSGR